MAATRERCNSPRRFLGSTRPINNIVIRNVTCIKRWGIMNFVSSYKYTSCHFLPSNGSREIGKSNFLSINLRLLGKIETGLFNHLLEEGEEADGYSREIYFKNSPRFPLSWPEIARPILFEKFTLFSRVGIKCLTTLFSHLFSRSSRPTRHPILVSSLRHTVKRRSSYRKRASRQMNVPSEYRFSNHGSILLECSARS